MSQNIPYYDPADGRVIDFLDPQKCALLIEAGVAHVIRTKRGEIVRAYRVVRERVFGTANGLRDGSRTTRRYRRETGALTPREIREFMPQYGRSSTDSLKTQRLRGRNS
ncbi:MAG TPA: hypothetical protein VN442_00345 [Bryobacteraceae bacterium]|nr:hypothetical protein [Bryobacteraceae bacterium]